ncbi:chemotaxis protein CheA [Ectothiorhodospira marina]|uniref:Chemotaxis protein CheA n=1 Tax=Ectothiorhodospira marina TaxID=1396821 RepID=A0A1H7KHP5_9GAMM|nr:chemotaxis protein CheA [Ectothiorhodospira marina]SEK86318.1 two-component system, chemotaxis family, sensor kinase CheA [Ectothiorhodospira marina]
MNPLLDQFISESRDTIQSIGERLLQLENAPADHELMNELFRLVHTLKGNSGLFDFPEMTRVLHGAEDLMDAVRDSRIGYSQSLADQLLEAMDFISALLDEILDGGDASLPADTERTAAAMVLTDSLRQLITAQATQEDTATPAPETLLARDPAMASCAEAQIPEAARMEAYRQIIQGQACSWMSYQPEEDCFFKGEDPFYQITQLPAPLWRRVTAREPWPAPETLDAYRCLLHFESIVPMDLQGLTGHFRYIPDQVQLSSLSPAALAIPTGDAHDSIPAAEYLQTATEHLQSGDHEGLIQASRLLLELSSPKLRVASALRWLLLVMETRPDDVPLQQQLLDDIRHGAGIDTDAANAAAPSSLAPNMRDMSDPIAGIIATQAEILALTDVPPWLPGRLRAIAASLRAAFTHVGQLTLIEGLDEALQAALERNQSTPLARWLADQALPSAAEANTVLAAPPIAATVPPAAPSDTATSAGETRKFGRRMEDAHAGPSAIKVDQAKIDRLMNLIGEMIVAKNALPYLAARAENVFGVRELSREIRGQYSTLNRIADEMQDAIMQVRLLPVSFVFQRFPRLVRDTAHKLGKEVRLILEGEETEADKNVIESLADPLVHIIRNSLDHGLETPEERRAAGKPAAGRLTIRARSESDRVVIEIADDGRGIDPTVIRRKAYEKGIIDEQTLERLTDQEALNLIFAPGFSTAGQVSDLSGRGVGMDVVRTAVARVNGSIDLKSQPGEGTRLRLSLPLSMAVTNVMVIVSAGQRFGVAMDAVAETVQIAQTNIQRIKHQTATVLRDRVVPLVTLNDLLGLDEAQVPNEDGELAVVVVRIENDFLGIIVDDCRETVDIILKPLAGFLGNLQGYAGSALLGDGSVLLVLNPRELL